MPTYNALRNEQNSSRVISGNLATGGFKRPLQISLLDYISFSENRLKVKGVRSDEAFKKHFLVAVSF